jgi:hypothetical protein
LLSVVDPSVYRVLAHLVVVIHVMFILFVVFGGLLVLRRQFWLWLHIPAVLWAALVELNGWYCPLTPLENHLRQAGGLSFYSGDFIAEYIFPFLYPSGLTRPTQVMLGLGVLVINAAIYTVLIKRGRLRWRITDPPE